MTNPEEREADRRAILNELYLYGTVRTWRRLMDGLGMDAETAAQEVVDEINRQEKGRAA